MSILNFTKMHGCGNDYIYFNCMDNEIENPEELSIKISDRHFGVGGDGIVMILPSDVADVRMRMFNIDGSEGKMCGNAIRCVGKYAFDNGIVKKECITIETLSGIKTLDLTVKDGSVIAARVNMGKPILEPKNIPVDLKGDIIVNHNVKIEDDDYEITCVSMGNPHCIVFCDDVKDLPLEKIGKKFEKNILFPDGINTEFIKVIDKNTLEMRVWERGSGETLACGTGSCASVVASVLAGHCEKNQDILVKLIGGNLTINYTDEAVYMEGPCEKAFDGVIEYN